LQLARTSLVLLLVAAVIGSARPVAADPEPWAGNPHHSAIDSVCAIEARAHDEVRALAQQLRTLPEGAARRVLEQRIVAAKSAARASRNQLLSTAPAQSLTPPVVNAWPANGIAVCTSNQNQMPASQFTTPVPLQISDWAVPDGTGGAIVAWLDQRTDGSTFDIYAQHVLASGAVDASWPANGRAVCSVASNDQFDCHLASDGVGGAFVAWRDRRAGAGSDDIYLQRVLASGTIAGGWPANGLAVCTAIGVQELPVVVSDGLGGAIVAWDDDRAGGTTNDIYAQRVNATGAPQWAANGVVVCSATSWQQVPQIASDGANGAVLCWSDNRSGTPDVFVQRINGIGGKLWPATGVQACTGGGAVVRGAPALVSDGTGGAIVAWQDARSGAGNEDLYARHFLATGVADTAWTASGVVVCAASGKQERMRAVPDGSGGVIVAWKDGRTDVSGDIYAQHLTNSGAVASGWSGNGVSLCMQSGGQQNLDVAADGQGGALVVWQDHRGGSADIYAQHVSGVGHIAFPTNGLVVCNEANMDQFPAVCADPNGGGIVVWGDNRNTATTKQDIYAIGLTGFSNLTATVTPAGWSEPVAARNAPDATVGSAITSTTLTGNTSSTWFNFAGAQQGPYIAPTWSLRVLTDEEACCPVGVSEPEPSAIGTYIAINQGPTTVRGGRHTLTVQADGLDLVPESNEDDNEYRSQWVWTPLVVNSGTPNVRAHPPEQGLFANPNCDGFKYTHPSDVAWVVSEAPTSPGDDYDLYLFSDDATNSATGFSNLLTYSDLGNTLTDFIVGHRTGTPATVLPATVGYAKDGGALGYPVDQSDATGRSANTASASWTNQTLIGNRLADVYEGFFSVGTSYVLKVVRNSGASDLALQIFADTPGGIYKRAEALVFSTAVNPSQDEAVITPTHTGWYPIVVYRDHGDSSDVAVNYTFSWTPMPAAGVPLPEMTLGFSGAMPNPARGLTQFAYSLPQAGHVRLSLIDVSGRLVRKVIDREMPAGHGQVAWDGRSDNGAQLGAGLYWAQFEAAGQRLVRTVVLLR